jgi:hypothetical protein
MSSALTLEPAGAFSLQAAAEFAFGPSEGRAAAFDGAMRLAFAVDGGGYAGILARQPRTDGPLECAWAAATR